eukprot:716200-Pleurochrysis_carterae.AAC.4
MGRCGERALRQQRAAQLHSLEPRALGGAHHVPRRFQIGNKFIAAYKHHLLRLLLSRLAFTMPYLNFSGTSSSHLHQLLPA